MNSIFNIDKFNIISDNDNYYFFKRLNSNMISSKKRDITKIKTDRSCYNGISKYNEKSILSLEEIYDCIKINNRPDTNCISLSMYASKILMSNRTFDNKYVLIRVPKVDFSKKMVCTSAYILEEIDKRIKDYLDNNHADDLVLYFMSAIDNIKTVDSFDKFISLMKNLLEISENQFDNFIKTNYSSLTSFQNLEKNKLIAKLNLIGKNIISNIDNKFLIQALDNSINCLDITHYGDMTGFKIIELPSEIVYAFSLLEQLPVGYPLVDDLKLELLNYAIKRNKSLEKFNLKDKFLELESVYTIDRMYELTKGSISYDESIKMYKKLFYLAKSKLKGIKIVHSLKMITNNNPKYNSIFEYLLNNQYRIDLPKTNNNLGYNNFKNENQLLNFISTLDIGELEHTVSNPEFGLKKFLDSINEEKNKKEKENYFIEAIIYSFNFKSIGFLVDFTNYKKSDMIDTLKKHDVIKKYYELKELGVNEEDIIKLFLISIIKNKNINQIKIGENYTIPKFRKKNDQLRNLCFDYDIDINEYGNLLNKNYDEVYAKICFLSDNEAKVGYSEELKSQLQLFVDGKLSEIFFMSDMNMRIKYDISLKEMIDRYVLHLDKSKGAV